MKRARDIAPSCSGSQFRARSCLNTRVEMSGLFKPLSLRIAINGRSRSGKVRRGPQAGGGPSLLYLPTLSMDTSNREGNSLPNCIVSPDKCL